MSLISNQLASKKRFAGNWSLKAKAQVLSQTMPFTTSHETYTAVTMRGVLSDGQGQAPTAAQLRRSAQSRRANVTFAHFPSLQQCPRLSLNHRALSPWPATRTTALNTTPARDSTVPAVTYYCFRLKRTQGFQRHCSQLPAAGLNVQVSSRLHHSLFLACCCCRCR